jgi:hypothetical protein
MADEPINEAKAPRGRRFLRMFLMAAGGLAAPCLALAAFFISNGGGSDTPARSAAVQSGRVTATTGPRTAPAVPVTTSTTTPPAAPTAPARDPFVPLVSQTPVTPAAGTPAR